MIVCPAIDVLEGRVVRLQQGDFEKVTVYEHSPLQWAQRIRDAGFHAIHLVDLQGSRQASPAILPLVERITRQTSLQVQFGGGVRSLEDVRGVLYRRTAERVVIGTVAARQPELLRQCVDTFGAARIVVAVDSRDDRVLVDAWRSDSGWRLSDLLDLLQTLGVQRVLCTDIVRDGLRTGPAVELYGRIKRDHPALHLTASGGVHHHDDLAALADAGVDAVVIGRALLEGDLDVEWLAERYGG
jgi:phosphoribosylformimino-5-aminoimidazole carboxamide ribotide isomerase